MGAHTGWSRLLFCGASCRHLPLPAPGVSTPSSIDHLPLLAHPHISFSLAFFFFASFPFLAAALLCQLVAVLCAVRDANSFSLAQ